ncbi:hypothetical protein OG558_18535 [Kribbella sp. NBC_01510]|uniref:hypothetical protein n=1 Tax=Kribbella sp. NBC_01510 TaxID=2903581 RepID=UPI0038678D5F
MAGAARKLGVPLAEMGAGRRFAPPYRCLLVQGAAVAPLGTEELMHPYIGKAMAEARQDELLAQAERHRLVRAARAGRTSWPVRWLHALRRRSSGGLRTPPVSAAQPGGSGGMTDPS